ncbi:MAG: AMP-binding protein, partial [Afipia sp.]|nr:AMP-binding protein [Afipia sp.]
MQHVAGLMQDAPLLISGILEYAARAHGKREIVSKAVVEPVWRYDWHRCDQRARQAAQALGVLGIATGDGVSSLAWNTPTATSNSSMRRRACAVLHTANPRLSDKQIAFTIAHAGSRILFFEPNLAELVA